jgi:hypothetical protein
MSIADLVNGEFAHLDPAAQAAAIDKAEADLVLLPEADLVRIMAAMGVEIANRRQGAEVVAAIRAVAPLLVQVGLLAL